MRKLSTLFLFTLFLCQGWSQICTVTGSDFAANFIICANNPATESIVFGPASSSSGYGVVLITGTNPTVDLRGLTIYVPKKILIRFSGNVIIDAGTNFQQGDSGPGQQGNSEVQFGAGGTVYKGNPGANSFEVLNDLIVACSADPNPMECLEIQSFLPVELTSFRGAALNDQVELHWTTATELNNDFFAIEHSTDGIAFRTVGQVKGAGTTSEEVQYEFMHRKPIAGTNYYRLKQVDFDGTVDYSDLIAVDMYKRSGGISVFPNPTIDRVVVQLEERPERAAISLMNILGQSIDLTPLTTDLGWELHLADLEPGMYMLRIEANGKIITKQIVKR